MGHGKSGIGSDGKRRTSIAYYQAIGPDSASTAIAAVTPKSTMKLSFIAKRMAHKLREM